MKTKEIKNISKNVTIESINGMGDLYNWRDQIKGKLNVCFSYNDGTKHFEEESFNTKNAYRIYWTYDIYDAFCEDMTLSEMIEAMEYWEPNEDVDYYDEDVIEKIKLEIAEYILNNNILEDRDEEISYETTKYIYDDGTSSELWLHLGKNVIEEHKIIAIYYKKWRWINGELVDTGDTETEYKLVA